MELYWIKEKLVNSLQSPLPGWESQKKLSPGYNEEYRIPKPDCLQASVLALIAPKEGVPHLTLIKRASHYAQDKHKGQISFPGGRIEKNESKLDAVLRETHEEIGLTKDQFEIIGELSSLYVFVSNFLVFPFVAISKQELEFTLDPKEVERVIQWPIKDLMNNVLKGNIQGRTALLKNVPYYPLDQDILWGATSMMTAELLDLIKN